MAEEGRTTAHCATCVRPSTHYCYRRPVQHLALHCRSVCSTHPTALGCAPFAVVSALSLARWRAHSALVWLVAPPLPHVVSKQSPPLRNPPAILSGTLLPRLSAKPIRTLSSLPLVALLAFPLPAAPSCLFRILTYATCTLSTSAARACCMSEYGSADVDSVVTVRCRYLSCLRWKSPCVL